MNQEAKKTLIFVGAALVIGIFGVAVQSRRPTTRAEVMKQVGQPLFEEFKNVDDVASLEITEVNEELASTKSFKVAKRTGTDVWVLPSESNYPADATEQVRDAATMFIDLKIKDVASERSDEHSLLGVVEPSEENFGKEGIGKLVVLQDRKNVDLVRVIIGSEVPNSEGARFARRPGQDVTFVAQIDESKFSTKFSDWIKKDLLDVNALDIEDIELKDYSVIDVRNSRGEISKFLSPRMEASLHWDSSNWSLEQLLVYNDEREKVPTPLGEDEELNSQKLNDLKYAVDDLEIVAVHPKPEGLGADLTAGAEFMQNKENLTSLQQRGYYAQELADGKFDLKAANGEAHVTTNKGIRYVLRFGEINLKSGIEEGTANRYLFVTAQVDESKFPKPVKEQLPGAIGPAQPAPGDAPKDEPKADAPKDEPKADAPKDEPKADAPKDEPKADAPKDGPKADAPKDEPKADAPKDEPKADAPKDEPKATGDECQAPPVEEPAAEPKADDDQPAPKAEDQKPAPKAEPPAGDEPGSTPSADLDKFRDLQQGGLPNRMDDTVREAELQRIEKEYQRKVDEREENLKEARARVAELNARFAGWYYVVSEDTYKKIHLGREDIIKKKDATPPADGAGALPGGGPSLGLPFGN
ncbi:MAG: DUF4340 domain-containing protein [Planctomycetales bacterium]|nr:DUF4340 domain-containing protein [Planctomycetales bacterium]